MKRFLFVILTAALCVVLAAPALAAESDYTFDDDCFFKKSANGSDGLVVDSLGDGRVFYTKPYGDAWSVSFHVDLKSGNNTADPEANARFAILGEEFELLGLITAKTMIGRDSPDTRAEVQQLMNNNWSHLGVAEWTKHSDNAYDVVISKKANDNSLYITLKDADGTEFINLKSDPFNADLMATARHFGFYVYNSVVEFSNINYTGFAGSGGGGGGGSGSAKTGDTLFPAAAAALVAAAAGLFFMKRKAAVK